MKYSPWLAGLTLLPLLSMGAHAQNPVSFSGDLRFGGTSFDRDERDGSNIDRTRLQLRARAGLEWNISDIYSAKVRYAARVHNTGNESATFKLYRAVPRGASSLHPGQSTLDELFIKADYGNWEHKVGRFQTNNLLDTVPAKSFSRTDSTSWDISWTDGIHSRYTLPSGWQVNMIAEHNSKRGPTHIRRAPLSFERSASRAAYYVSLDHSEPDGLFLQRSVDVTLMPSALYYNGLQRNEQRDYVGFTTRLLMQWQLSGSTRLTAGGELAWAPETPTLAALNLPGRGKADGRGYQLTANLMDFAPGHSIGVIYAETDAGWLLSTDFDNNEAQVEVRYAWAVMPGHEFQARIRQRDDKDRYIGAQHKRAETDVFVRYTITM